MLEGKAVALIRGMRGSHRENRLPEVCRQPGPFGRHLFRWAQPVARACQSRIFNTVLERMDFASLARHQPFPGTAQSELNPERCCEKDVNFSGLNFLEVASGNLRPLGQFFLRQTFPYTFAAHVRTENLYSRPLFSAQRHDILHRFQGGDLNDTYIVKILLHFLEAGVKRTKRLRTMS